MAAAWTANITWDTSKAITVARLNAFIGLNGNTDYLLNRPGTQATISSNASTTSTTFVDVSATLNLSLTTVSPRLLIFITAAKATISGSTGNGVVDFFIDGVNVTNGLTTMNNNSTTNGPFTAICIVSSVTAGAHVIKPQFKETSGSTLTLTGNVTFGVQEIG